MFERLIELDKQCLVFLNGLGTTFWDPFWLFVTNQFNWTPVFLLVLYFIFKYLGWKKGVFLLVFLSCMIAFSDQFTNLIRVIFERNRPNNDPEINSFLRILIQPKSYSFTSGHATTSTAVAVFVILVLRKHFKYIKWFVLFPLIFSYSRLYLGVHFPIDIIVGACVGMSIGVLCHRFFCFLERIFIKSY